MISGDFWTRKQVPNGPMASNVVVVLVLVLCVVVINVSVN